MMQKTWLICDDCPWLDFWVYYAALNTFAWFIS
jgi:hypothetical protein